MLVSAIGGQPVLGDPARRPLDLPSRLLTDAVAQGLVRFDAAGQIEPGLAERWTVIDAGATYIFRLREAYWSDGSPVTAPQVVARLQHQLAPGSRNPLRPYLSAIGEIVVMTPQVIEVHLKRPRPDLLKLFAQPELAIVRPVNPAGSGPLQPARESRAVLLRPMTGRDGSRDAQIRLQNASTAMAVARFAAGQADLVTGGTFADWPLASAAGVPAAQLRVDPTAGILGLAIASREGFLADPANRAAVAEAIDAAAVLGAVWNGWLPDPRLLPDRLDANATPALAPWAATPIEDRRTAARARVAAWATPVRVRVALPAGPGATAMWGQIAASLLRVGITPVRVSLDQPGELRLIDVVAPYDSARWYLASACQPCGGDALSAIKAARDAPTMALRAQRLTEADAALATDVAFIPLGRPLRWSLVAPRLRQWQPNARAWHPLNRLRADPT